MLYHKKYLDLFCTKGNLIITDPCYEKDGGLGLSIPVKPGIWKACAILTDDRVSNLLAWHESSREPTSFNGKTSHVGTISVDSGQAGIFDRSVEIGGDSEAYDLCCDTTNICDVGIILGKGVVSSSGYGDSTYDVYGKKTSSGLYTSLMIEHILGVLEAVNTSLDKLPLLIGRFDEPASLIIEERIRNQE
jgi:hypothetical protein